MVTEHPIAPSPDAPVRRRDLAVARSLDSARVRSEGRVQRFLDAGFELMASAQSGKDFTVQEVVDRSGQSLRSFYQYFAGKHELLLALFDEAIRATADRLEEEISPSATRANGCIASLLGTTGCACPPPTPASPRTRRPRSWRSSATSS